MHTAVKSREKRVSELTYTCDHAGAPPGVSLAIRVAAPKAEPATTTPVLFAAIAIG